MIQSLIDAISLALNGEFEGLSIYTSTVEQGLETPCFLIRLINPTNERFMGNKYMRTNRFAIQYIPKTGRDEFGNVIDRLFLCLQNITDLDGETYEGGRMSAENDESSSTFFVSYDFFIYKKKDEEDSIEEFKMDQTVRS